jgi:hypothetical protein
LYIKIKEDKFLFIIKYWRGKHMGINSKEIIENKKLEEILKMVGEVKYGSITLIIQDGVIIQVDKNEKIRMK